MIRIFSFRGLIVPELGLNGQTLGPNALKIRSECSNSRT